MNTHYQEQQIGYVPVAIFGLCTAGMFYLGFLFGYNILFILLTIFFFAVTVVYSNMRTTVTDDHIIVRLGWVFEQQIPLAEVTGIADHEESLMSDWGIRPLGNGWLFSISGYAAIDIHMRNGSMFVIGTQRPSELLSAIQQAKQVRISVGVESS
ncbi:MAG: hypothetical protein TR69_WS6001000114 [candidate division WS6 bacterium OLB20]|uniref:Bacterial Pleckstrin homology domain-containing protein n=1 Tax=candidate division WS6 bacterium OLB20 TaxID=1617426 RepID=A0A136M021_9BACT|nr:MAG: hypothetical protein TR69_WS6001000114 [candidate division WS6 bacterium OLB20]